MTYDIRAALFASVATLIFASCPALAQDAACSAGRASGGECVDAELATLARQSAVIFSQPKISHTAFPVLPSADRLYRYPNQLIPDQLRLTPVGTPSGG
jgi:hypothetical protein